MLQTHFFFLSLSRPLQTPARLAGNIGRLCRTVLPAVSGEQDACGAVCSNAVQVPVTSAIVSLPATGLLIHVRQHLERHVQHCGNDAVHTQ
jgi:hypothetical protein